MTVVCGFAGESAGSGLTVSVPGALAVIRTVTVSPDPADSPANPQTTVIVTGLNPPGDVSTPITDEQVFLLPSSLTILADTEGEFTNLRNPLDVSSDGKVSAIDALMVINDLNAFGARSLSQLSLGMNGWLPPQFFLDVNHDTSVSPLDALMVINHLNASLASSPPQTPPGAGGEGEGEGEAAPDGASFVLALTAPQAGQEGGDAGEPAPPESQTTSTAGSTSADTSRRGTNTSDRPLARRLARLEAEAAADEVFATLSQILRSRFGRK